MACFHRIACDRQDARNCLRNLCQRGAEEEVHILNYQLTVCYKEGLPAEEIAEQYPHINLAQVYAGLAYLLPCESR